MMPKMTTILMKNTAYMRLGRYNGEIVEEVLE
jgi:hypothetical protein